MSPQQTVEEHQAARLSLPTDNLQVPALDARRPDRADTLPSTSVKGTPSMVGPEQVAELLQAHRAETLLLDVRVYPQYAASRITGALNLCIPTTLLKRPAFSVHKLAETFTDEQKRRKFENYKNCRYIVVYDACSTQPRDAVTPMHVLKKFVAEGWHGHALILKGGFTRASEEAPDMIDKSGPSSASATTAQKLSITPPIQDAVPVAGGCSMPASKSAANPFFGNIRQNMDLIDGVGQMAIQRPPDMSEQAEAALPAWLRKACQPANQGKLVADKFLAIEREEQKTMQEALSCRVSYGTPAPEQRAGIQVAGIEKGGKNRYNNIFPYDHTRVKLQNVPAGECDYVNANFVQAAYATRRYIATQAPIPATFNDFWRVVWEQDVRVIVSLTAEVEGGQIKCHQYWQPGEYGPLKLKKLSERRVTLMPTRRLSTSSSSLRRPSLGQRRSTNPNTASERQVAEAGPPAPTETPWALTRHLALSHSAYPFQPMREITLLQFSQWPDFGAPAHPRALLGLIEEMNQAVGDSRRPILVHCSAGCGRTGTFCTIDSVIEMLKRQRLEARDRDRHAMDVDHPDDWVHRDDIDLVQKTVEDFRRQRLSMVQNLRQFVLCYETVLQWIVAQQPDSMRSSKETARRSYQR